ncbi:hypothetical protein EB796_006762 [Bugula neritina]|uniref:Uncharacterized protein n=1 Tax=Bugula neritina TaxID=10212 RepID=A0A7J7KBK2_BUGNE|nr:hypothetical protein EB796_006762 [Bugula neritina]
MLSCRKLIGGDCGSLVYVKVGAEFKPTGLFIGYVADSENIPGFDGPIYQAVVLSQAFKNMECDYPHQVSNIELFSQERYSQLVTDGHFNDSSLFHVS